MSAESIAKALWDKNDLFETDVHGIMQCNLKGEADDAKFRLAYMPCRNRGEIIRLMLEEAQVPYEVEVVGFERWRDSVKASTPHGKLPVLRNYDGKGNDLGQEGAITRFVADQCGLAGKDALERARIDELYCQWLATLRNNGLSHDGEHFSVAALKQGGAEKNHKTSKNVIQYQDMFRLNKFSRFERSLTALRYFEECLGSEGTGFLVGDCVSFVDFGLFYILFELAEEDNVPDFAEKFDFPNLGAFLRRMEQRPHILDYLKSPRRMPRYQRDDSGASLYTYVAGKYSPEF